MDGLTRSGVPALVEEGTPGREHADDSQRVFSAAGGRKGVNYEGRGQHGNVSEVVNECEPFWALGKCEVNFLKPE